MTLAVIKSDSRRTNPSLWSHELLTFPASEYANETVNMQDPPPHFTHHSGLNNIALADRLRQRESICWREKQYDSFLPGERWLEKTIRRRQEGWEQAGALEGTRKCHNHQSQGSLRRTGRDICMVVNAFRSSQKTSKTRVQIWTQRFNLSAFAAIL